MEGRRWSLWLLLILAGIVALALVGQRITSIDEVDGSSRLLYLVLLLSAVGGGVLYRFKAETRTALAQLGIWIALLAGLTLAYSFKDDVKALGQRFTRQLDARSGTISGDHAVSFSRAESGHFEVTAALDGVPTTFYVDTGATAIVLTPQAAERLGYDVNALTYDILSETANGLGRSAAIRINELVMGPIVMHDVAAHVNQSQMSRSLLGMQFVSQLRSMHIDGDTLTFAQ
ncbi:MAG: TIGR02281 family clan AA aspartic protease [Proteobacteria bacterium]|nr:TIGR02281 family clan AA aspartic protease [Pseudomonadota bacterium]